MFQRYNSEVPLEGVMSLVGVPSAPHEIALLASEKVSFHELIAVDVASTTDLFVEVPLTLDVAVAFDVLTDDDGIICSWVHTTDDLVFGGEFSFGGDPHASVLVPAQTAVNEGDAWLNRISQVFTCKGYKASSSGIPAGMKQYFRIASVNPNKKISGYIRANVKELKSFQPLK